MDAALVERAREGDREAFATLARHALPWMDGVARLTLRDPDLARDAVQEALLRAWKGLPGLRDPAQFQAWLRRLVVRSCIDELRRTRGRHSLEVTLTELHSPAILDTSISSADRDALERAFQRLDPVQRSAIGATGPTGRVEALEDGLDPDAAVEGFGSIWIPWDSHQTLYRYPVDALAP